MSTILIVDDNASARETLIAMLEGEHYQLELAKDGFQTLQILNRLKPDLILLDEPFNELDEDSSITLLKHFKELAASGKMIIMITHQNHGV